MELLKKQEAYDTTQIVRQFLEATPDASDEESQPNAKSLTARLCTENLELFRTIVKQLKKHRDYSKSKTKPHCISLERSYSRLKLWSDNYGVSQGELDEVLAKSRKLRRAALKLLTSIATTLTDRLSVLCYDDYSSESSSRPLSGIVLDLRFLLEDVDGDCSETSSCGSSSDYEHDDIKEIAEDLMTDTTCLVELDPLIKSPVFDVRSEKATAYINVEEWEPYRVYCDKVENRFPQTANSLILRLGKANYQRYVRCQEERDRHENAHTGPTVSVEGSKFHDSAIGSSRPNMSSYAETIMSYGGGAERSVRVPPLPTEARAGNPFTCVACGKSVIITNNSAWKQHLYSDLCPWVCLDASCSFGDNVFQSRNDWISHLGLNHGLAPYWFSFECPLCHEHTGNGKITIIRHIGGHLEEISLGALPSGVNFDSESDHESQKSHEADIFTRDAPGQPNNPLRVVQEQQSFQSSNKSKNVNDLILEYLTAPGFTGGSPAATGPGRDEPEARHEDGREGWSDHKQLSDMQALDVSSTQGNADIDIQRPRAAAPSRSLISSSEHDTQGIEKEIEEFARQIQEEGLLDGLDLDDIDLAENEALSRRITEAYRRKQRGRVRHQGQYREYNEEVPVKPLALVSDRQPSDEEIKMEIERLEAERDLLKAGGRHHHHSHSRHRSHSHSTDSELVSAERLPKGEEVEHIEEPRRGVNIRQRVSTPRSSLAGTSQPSDLPAPSSANSGNEDDLQKRIDRLERLVLSLTEQSQDGNKTPNTTLPNKSPEVSGVHETTELPTEDQPQELMCLMPFCNEGPFLHTHDLEEHYLKTHPERGNVLLHPRMAEISTMNPDLLPDPLPDGGYVPMPLPPPRFIPTDISPKPTGMGSPTDEIEEPVPGLPFITSQSYHIPPNPLRGNPETYHSVGGVLPRPRPYKPTYKDNLLERLPTAVQSDPSKDTNSHPPTAQSIVDSRIETSSHPSQGPTPYRSSYENTIPMVPKPDYSRWPSRSSWVPVEEREGRRKVAETLMDVVHHLGTPTPTRFDNSEIKHGEVPDAEQAQHRSIGSIFTESSASYTPHVYSRYQGDLNVHGRRTDQDESKFYGPGSYGPAPRSLSRQRRYQRWHSPSRYYSLPRPRDDSDVQGHEIHPQHEKSSDGDNVIPNEEDIPDN